MCNELYVKCDILKEWVRALLQYLVENVLFFEGFRLEQITQVINAPDRQFHISGY